MVQRPPDNGGCSCVSSDTGAAEWQWGCTCVPSDTGAAAWQWGLLVCTLRYRCSRRTIGAARVYPQIQVRPHDKGAVRCLPSDMGSAARRGACRVVQQCPAWYRGALCIRDGTTFAMVQRCMSWPSDAHRGAPVHVRVHAWSTSHDDGQYLRSSPQLGESVCLLECMQGTPPGSAHHQWSACTNPCK